VVALFFEGVDAEPVLCHEVQDSKLHVMISNSESLDNANGGIHVFTATAQAVVLNFYSDQPWL